MIGLGWFLFGYHAPVVGVLDNYSSIIMTCIYGFFFSGLFFRFSVIACLFSTLIYLFAILTANLDGALTVSLVASLIVVFLLLALAAYQKEQLSRRLFVTETKARRALASQSRHDSRYLQWLRSLADFLRHEVRQPVAQVSTSIELIQLEGPHNKRVEKFLANAADGTRHIANLIERATRATRIETFVRQGKSQDVRLDGLIIELVDAYRQTYSGLMIELAGVSEARVHADPSLLREAVDNLVANAASYSLEDHPVELSLATDADSAIIIVRNKGPLLPDDSTSLFDPFSSTRAGPTSVHHGLGLYIVRLVAEEYGGTALLSNLADRTGVEASIRLPRVTNQRRSAESYLQSTDNPEPVLT
ncbi:sensor histidine kinase [Mesorhizobium huakuii]|uniref:sensor histidine kinase n=1 Tax=Mesorhizobium huakuii TaxID=28104 RepID=UPI0024E10D89|nr:ATP-binding protein [Mesorhizobium huakuii]